MGKIIIHNTSKITDVEAATRVASVMAGGKISQTAGVKHYCHACSYHDNTQLYCLNRGGSKDTFYVYDNGSHPVAWADVQSSGGR